MKKEKQLKENNSGLKQVGVIKKSVEHGWHMEATVPWEEMKEGTKVYVAVEFSSIIDKFVNLISKLRK